MRGIAWGGYLDGFQDVQDQLRQHIWQRATAATARADEERRRLDKESFRRRQERLRALFLESLGGLPTEKTPLEVQHCGTVDRPGHRIEKLVYQSLPGFYVTANLYIPNSLNAPAPAVLKLCGHQIVGKAYAKYQQVCLDLVAAGFVVLTFDPIGQGERLQYYNPATGQCDVTWGTTEHTYEGFQCSLIGANVARYFAWDAVRAIDLLTQRSEVDPARIGMTGNSGGGTQTAILAMVDERIAAASCCTYINNRYMYMGTGQGQDSEQNFYGVLRDGLDYADMLAGMAPKPVQIGACASDFFLVEGAYGAFEDLRHIYSLFDAADSVRLVVSPGRHQYSAVLRRETVNFFRRHLMNENLQLPSLAVAAGPDESPLAPNIPDAAEIVPPQVADESALQCTRAGQVNAEYAASVRTVYDLNLSAWRRLQKDRGVLSPSSVRASLEQLARAGRTRTPLWVRHALEGDSVNGPLPRLTDVPWPDVSEYDGAAFAWQHLYFFSEPGIAVPMIELRAKGVDSTQPLSVVVCEDGTKAFADEQHWAQTLLARERRLLFADPRGTGATAQRPINARRTRAVVAGGLVDQMNPYQAWHGTEARLNRDAMMLGDSLFAMRVYDLDRVLEYAHRIAPSVKVIGQGIPGLWLLAAAALQGLPVEIELYDVPTSLAGLVEQRLAPIDFRLEVFGLLKEWDVADLEGAIVDCGGCVRRLP